MADAPESFGWVMDGWVARLGAWDAARTRLAALNPQTHPHDHGAAQIALWEAETALHEYKAQMRRGLTLVLGWLRDDLPGEFKAALARESGEQVDALVKPLTAKVRRLEQQVEILTSLVASLSERVTHEDVVGAGPGEGADTGNQSGQSASPTIPIRQAR